MRDACRGIKRGNAGDERRGTINGSVGELPHSSPIFILMSCWYLALKRFRSLKNAEVQLNMSKALSICSEQAVLYQILNKIFFNQDCHLFCHISKGW